VIDEETEREGFHDRTYTLSRDGKKLAIQVEESDDELTTYQEAGGVSKHLGTTYVPSVDVRLIVADVREDVKKVFGDVGAL
jgi:hypothetical protein